MQDQHTEKAMKALRSLKPFFFFFLREAQKLQMERLKELLKQIFKLFVKVI